MCTHLHLHPGPSKYLDELIALNPAYSWVINACDTHRDHAYTPSQFSPSHSPGFLPLQCQIFLVTHPGFMAYKSCISLGTLQAFLPLHGQIFLLTHQGFMDYNSCISLGTLQAFPSTNSDLPSHTPRIHGLQILDFPIHPPGFSPSTMADFLPTHLGFLPCRSDISLFQHQGLLVTHPGFSTTLVHVWIVTVPSLSISQRCESPGHTAGFSTSKSIFSYTPPRDFVIASYQFHTHFQYVGPTTQFPQKRRHSFMPASTPSNVCEHKFSLSWLHTVYNVHHTTQLLFSWKFLLCKNKNCKTFLFIGSPFKNANVQNATVFLQFYFNE